MDPEVLTANGQVPHDIDEACRSLRTSTVFGRLPTAGTSNWTGETHVALYRPSWKRRPFLISVFQIWSRRMFIWSQWCAWSSGFRRKVATIPSFLVAKSRVPVAKCDYAPGFFEPWWSYSLSQREQYDGCAWAGKFHTDTFTFVFHHAWNVS